MINIFHYKLFNPDLKNLNNNQLVIHWNNIGKNENRVYSLEYFFILYPYFDYDMYKLYNNDLIFKDKIEAMIHWHTIGNKENRLCSDKQFNDLYPNLEINIDNNLNIYDFKNNYHNNFLKNNGEKKIFEENIIQEEIFNETIIQKEIFNETIIQKEIFEKNIIQEEIFKENIIQEEIFDETIIQEEIFDETIIQKEIFENNTIISNIYINYVIILSENENIIKILNSVKALNINYKIFLVLNGINFENNIIDINKIEIIKIYQVHYEFIYLIKNFIIINYLLNTEINTEINTESNWVYFIDDNTKIEEGIYNKINNLNDIFIINNNIILKSSILSNNFYFKNNINIFLKKIKYMKYKFNDNIKLDRLKLNNKYTTNKYYLNNLENTRENLNLSKNLFLDNKKNIGIHISKKQYDNIDEKYYIKCLSLLNYNIMNIILFIEDKTKINTILFLKYINYILISDITSNYTEEDEFMLISKCDYIISYDSKFSISAGYLSNAIQIFLPNFLNNKFDIVLNNISYIFIDNIIDNYYLENNILITPYNNYIIKKNNLIKINNNSFKVCYLQNKLYLLEHILNNYKYNLKEFNIENNIKFIKFTGIQDINNLNYGIVNYKNKYYYKLFNKYSSCNINIIKNNLPFDFEYIYIEEINKDVYDCCVLLKFNFNIIFIINDINEVNNESNLLLLLKQDYENLNIIIFFNIEVSKDYENKFSNFIKNNNINNILFYIFKSSKIISNIEIIIFSTKLAKDNSIMVIIDNTFLLNPLFSLDYINLLYFSKKLLITDFYSNENINLLFFKKELLLSLPNYILNKINNNYLEYLLLLFKKITNNYYLRKHLNNKINENIIIKNIYNLENNYIINNENNNDLINNFNALNLKEYCYQKYKLLFSNIDIDYIKNDELKEIQIIENDIKENDIKENDIKENNYNDLLLYLYRINYIEHEKYKELENNLYINILNNISKYQLVLFIDENIQFDFLAAKLEELNIIIKENKENIQINIIEFKSIFQKDKVNIICEKYNINYIFLDTNNVNDKYKFNKSFAYNLLKNIMTYNLFEYDNYIFYNIKSNKKLYITESNNYDIDNLIINKNLFEEVGGFDYELFFDNFGYETYYFIKKINILNKIEINILNKIEINNNELNGSLFKNYYLNLFNIIENIDTSFLYFLRNRNIINYNLFSEIDIFLINLEERKDRLLETYNEFQKIDLYEYNRFNAIKPIVEDLKDCKIINPSKLWKKNNIEYLKSALGCKMSHLEILKSAFKSDSNKEYILIIEDDVVFEKNTIIYLNLALNQLIRKNWDILFLATNLKNQSDAEKVDTNLLKINKGLTTTAQLFKRENLEKIINIIEKSEYEIDNTYNDLLENKFCVYPMCVYQRESYSDINKKNMNYGDFHKKFKY